VVGNAARCLGGLRSSILKAIHEAASAEPLAHLAENLERDLAIYVVAGGSAMLGYGRAADAAGLGCAAEQPRCDIHKTARVSSPVRLWPWRPRFHMRRRLARRRTCHASGS
jgi:hypothetical protein